MFPILNPPPSSLPIPSLWVVPVYQPQASSIMHRTWTGNSFDIYYTCFNAILPNHPTLSFSHRVQKTVLYICVSFAVLHTSTCFETPLIFISLQKAECTGIFTSLLQKFNNSPGISKMLRSKKKT